MWPPTSGTLSAMTDYVLREFSHVTAVPIRVADGWRGHLVLVHDGRAAIAQVPLVRDPGLGRPRTEVDAAFEVNVGHLLAWIEQLSEPQRLRFHRLVTETDDP